MSKAHPTAFISDLLPGIVEELKGHSRPSLETIQKIWRRLAGVEASRHSWPRRLSKGRLLVEVENSGWMYTLHLKRLKLLQGLVELLGAGQVRELSFRIGEKKDS